MKRLMCFLMMLTVSVMMFAKGEVKKVVYTLTPKLKCEKCEAKMKGNLKFERGLKSITPDHKTNTLTLTFDSEKTSKEKIEKALKKLGYKVEEKTNK